jgi:uncharacterized protein YkwD
MKARFSKKPVLFIAGLLILIYIAVSIGYVLGEDSKVTPSSSSTTAQATADGGIKLSGSELKVSDIDVYRLWSLVNSQRTVAGLPGLSLDPELNQSAASKCNDMVTRNYWSHDTPDGKSFHQQAVDSGVKFYRFGENLAEAFDSADAVVSGWMKSAEHKANILDPGYTEVGYAVCKSDHFTTNNNSATLLVVQHFDEP